MGGRNKVMVNGNVSIAMHTAFFQVLATSSYNRVSQSDSRIQILLQLDWMARFSLLQPDVARPWKNAVPLKNKNTYALLPCPSTHMFQQTGDKEGEEVERGREVELGGL